MLRIAFAAAIAAGLMMLAADPAAARHRRPASSPICANPDVMRPCQVGPALVRRAAVAHRSLKRIRRHHGASLSRAHRRASLGHRRASRSARATPGLVRRASAGDRGLVPALSAKVGEILSACSSRVVSGVRRTMIAGTRRISLHASGRAADLAGDPSCIYAHLAGWRGGYSVDYARVRHVHVSWDPEGGREMGLRFRHGGGHIRHARHHRHRGRVRLVQR